VKKAKSIVQLNWLILACAIFAIAAANAALRVRENNLASQTSRMAAFIRSRFEPLLSRALALLSLRGELGQVLA